MRSTQSPFEVPILSFREEDNPHPSPADEMFSPADGYQTWAGVTSGVEGLAPADVLILVDPRVAQSAVLRLIDDLRAYVESANYEYLLDDAEEYVREMDASSLWSDKPICKGWWWCFPDPRCEWYERYRNGLVVEAIEDDGHFYPELKGSVESVLGAMSGDYKGFSGKYGTDLFGRWYGPIQTPESKD